MVIQFFIKKMSNTADIMKIIAELSELKIIDDVPIICAVGAEASGKSTFLNILAGIKIFPHRQKGDIVTGAMTRMQIIVTILPHEGDYIVVARRRYGEPKTFTNPDKTETEKLIY